MKTYNLINDLQDKPSFSYFILFLRWIDKLISYLPFYGLLKEYFGSDYIIGGDFYDLCDQGLFKFIIRTRNNTTSSKYTKLRFVNMPVYLIYDHDYAKTILQSSDVIRGISYDRLVDFFGYGIFTSRIYDRWKKQRQTMLQLFAMSRLKQDSKRMYNIVSREMDKYIGEPVDLVLLLSQIGLVLFCELILGIDIQDIMNDLPQPINDLLVYINSALEPIKFKFGSEYRTFIDNRNKVHDWMKIVLNRIREGSGQNNPLTKYILDDGLSIDEQVEMLISVILGGHETTSRLMLGIMHSLIMDDKIRYILECELESYHRAQEDVYIDYGKAPDYLKNCILEGLRLFPPVWILSREPQKDLIVDDNFMIERGAQILISPLIMQRSKELWGDSSEQYLPERFKNYNFHKFMPFVTGKESCAGKNFALFESVIMIGNLIHNYKFTSVTDNIRPFSAGTFRLTDKFFVTITKKKSINGN